MEACHRSFSPQLFRQGVPFSNGDISVCSPVSAPWGLDGLHRPSGCLPSVSCPPGISSVPSILYRPSDIPVSSSVFWPFSSTASLHSCHGPGLLHHASFRLSDLPLPERLARPRILFSGDHSGKRLSCGFVRSWGF